MNAYTVRRVIWLGAVTIAMATVPAESLAIFHGSGCNSCGRGTTAYRPITPTYAPMAVAQPMAMGCSSCAQTCNYMPQTCYRTVYQQVPVTSFQPVAACGPCGNQVTAMRPVVTYQMQARLVPYTTYRPVFSPMGYAPAAVACPTGGCGSTVSYGAALPTVSTATGCSSCSAAVVPSYENATYSSPTYSTPSPSYSPSPAPSYTPAPATGSSSGAVQTPTPTLAPTEPARPQTFMNDEHGATEVESRLHPIPDKEQQQPGNKKTNSTLSPRLLDSQDRTTYRPLKYDVIPVSAAELTDGNDGWRPARR